MKPEGVKDPGIAGHIKGQGFRWRLSVGRPTLLFIARVLFKQVTESGLFEAMAITPAGVELWLKGTDKGDNSTAIDDLVLHLSQTVLECAVEAGYEVGEQNDNLKQPPTLSLSDFADVISEVHKTDGGLADRVASYFKTAPEFREYYSLLHQVIEDTGLDKSADGSFLNAARHHEGLERMQAGVKLHQIEEGGWVLREESRFDFEEVGQLIRLIEARVDRGDSPDYGEVKQKLQLLVEKHEPSSS